MSMSNTISLRQFFIWNSNWFCDFNYYNLVFEDIKISKYLNDIFYNFGLPTSNFIIKRYINQMIIQSNIHFNFLYKKVHLKIQRLKYLFRRHKKFSLNNFLLKKNTFFIFREYLHFFFEFFFLKSKSLSWNIKDFFNFNFVYFKFKKNKVIDLFYNSFCNKRKKLKKLFFDSLLKLKTLRNSKQIRFFVLKYIFLLKNHSDFSEKSIQVQNKSKRRLKVFNTSLVRNQLKNTTYFFDFIPYTDYTILRTPIKSFSVNFDIKLKDILFEPFQLKETILVNSRLFFSNKLLFKHNDKPNNNYKVHSTNKSNSSYKAYNNNTQTHSFKGDNRYNRKNHFKARRYKRKFIPATRQHNNDNKYKTFSAFKKAVDNIFNNKIDLLKRLIRNKSKYNQLFLKKPNTHKTFFNWKKMKTPAFLSFFNYTSKKSVFKSTNNILCSLLISVLLFFFIYSKNESSNLRAFQRVFNNYKQFIVTYIKSNSVFYLKKPSHFLKYYNTSNKHFHRKKLSKNKKVQLPFYFFKRYYNYVMTLCALDTSIKKTFYYKYVFNVQDLLYLYNDNTFYIQKNIVFFNSALRHFILSMNLDNVYYTTLIFFFKKKFKLFKKPLSIKCYFLKYLNSYMNNTNLLMLLLVMDNLKNVHVYKNILLYKRFKNNVYITYKYSNSIKNNSVDKTMWKFHARYTIFNKYVHINNAYLKLLDFKTTFAFFQDLTTYLKMNINWIFNKNKYFSYSINLLNNIVIHKTTSNISRLDSNVFYKENSFKRFNYFNSFIINNNLFESMYKHFRPCSEDKFSASTLDKYNYLIYLFSTHGSLNTHLKKVIVFFKKNTLLFNWFNKIIVTNIFKNVFYVFKNVLFLTLKKMKINRNIFYKNNVLLIFNYFINNYIVNKVIHRYYNNYNLFSSIYLCYNSNFNFKNYIEDITLLFTMKNNTFSYYYLKYITLNLFYFFYSLESTISIYSNQNCFLLLIYNFKTINFFNSAKILCEFITLHLKKKMTIRKVFFFIKKKQRSEMYRKNTLIRDRKNKFVKNFFINYRFPLKGIRVLYSGNLKKAKRKKKISYFVWLSNILYSGKMPFRQFKYYIDYHKRSVFLKNASVGIKVWLLYNIYKKKNIDVE